MGDKEYMNYKGYDIKAEKIGDKYKLKAWVYSMGEEYYEYMLADKVDEEVLDNFINKIERNK